MFFIRDFTAYTQAGKNLEAFPSFPRKQRPVLSAGNDSVGAF
jgi:hypothetical protein